MEEKTHDWTYDASEARSILDRAAENLDPDIDPHVFEAAIAKLNDDIEALHGTAGFEMERGPGKSSVLWIHAPTEQPRRVRVARAAPKEYDLGIFVPGGSVHLRIVGIRFNRATKRFEGLKDDPHVVPVPGQSMRKRSALAVVMEHVAKTLGDPASIDQNARF